MKLQSASKKEIKRVAIGTSICVFVLISGLFVLSLLGIGTFDHTVILGAAVGSAVAITNFTLMCLSIQQAVNITEQKRMKAFLQGSYNGRLLMQAVWVVIAFTVPHFNVIAAAVPLLFPNLVVCYLRTKANTAGSTHTPPDKQDKLGRFQA